MPPVRLRVCGCEIMMSDEGGCNNDDAIWPTDRRKAAKFNWINPSISPRRPSRFRSVSVSPSPFFYAALDCVCSYVRRRRPSFRWPLVRSFARSSARPSCPSDVQATAPLPSPFLARQAGAPPTAGPPTFLPYQARQGRHSDRLND